MKEYLFVYGTLLPDTATAPISSVVNRLRRAGPATVRGRLYDMGGFPGMIADGDQNVSGELLIICATSAWLRLDLYEGYDRANPERSFFRRERCVATLPDGQQMPAWVYLYNRDLEDTPPIKSGCWRTHVGDIDVLEVP